MQILVAVVRRGSLNPWLRLIDASLVCPARAVTRENPRAAQRILSLPSC